MTNKNEKVTSFWTSDRPPFDDLAGIQEYLKPRSATELSGFFVTPPSLSPSVEVEEPRQLPLDPILDELLEAYGITPEEFVHSAIEEPELWDEDELERLHAVLSGDLAPQAVADIVSEHFYAGGSRKAKQDIAFRAHEPTEDDLEDISDIVSDRLEVVENSPGGPEPLTDLPLGTINVGEWWTKRKS
jgi:hypothetical protein